MIMAKEDEVQKPLHETMAQSISGVSTGSTYTALSGDILSIVIDIVQLLRDNCNKTPDAVMKDKKKIMDRFGRLKLRQVIKARVKSKSRGYRSAIEDNL